MSSLLHRAAIAFAHPGGPYLFVRIVTALYAVSAVGRMLPVRRKQVPGFRRNPGRTVAVTAASVAVASAVGACTYMLPGLVPLQHHPSPPARTPPPVTQAPAPMQLGVFEPDEWATFQPVERFADATGWQPNIVLIYSGWPEPFQTKFADMAYAHHAEPFVQMEPVDADLASIADGGSDDYLRAYASQVRRYRHPVILSFAAEMNGDWYTWGAGHTSPSVFIKAWRHVVDTFRASGATNVRWLWTVFSTQNSSTHLRPWWPGARWVNMVGIDGYYYFRHDTFGTVFGSTVTEIRRFTRDPILISETSAGPRTHDQPGKITDLFAGIRADHLNGLVWFDEPQNEGAYHQDWRLEDNPEAVAAFRRTAAYYLNHPG